MKSFEYVIKDELGIHARPAGLLVKQCAEFNSSVKITCGSKQADAKRLFNVMGLIAKQGDLITFTIEGEDEEAAFSSIKNFVESNI